MVDASEMGTDLIGFEFQVLGFEFRVDTKLETA